MILDKKKKYLQIALNRTLPEVESMIEQIPSSNKIIIEAGYPFIKMYGQKGIRAISNLWSQKTKNGYVVADMKCMDRADTEVAIAKNGGAKAVTCLGLAPVETINQFISACKDKNMDSVLDMMNVKFPFEILQKLKQIPDIIMLHRGVDEKGNREIMIPHNQITRIKGTYDVIIAIAGGETLKETTRTFFNDADIAIVWEGFYNDPTGVNKLTEDFLKLIR